MAEKRKSKWIEMYYGLSGNWEEAHKQLGKHIGIVKHITEEYSKTLMCKGNRTHSGVEISFRTNIYDPENKDINELESDLEKAVTTYINKTGILNTLTNLSDYDLASKILKRFHKRLSRFKKVPGKFLPIADPYKWFVVDMK